MNAKRKRSVKRWDFLPSSRQWSVAIKIWIPLRRNGTPSEAEYFDRQIKPVDFLPFVAIWNLVWRRHFQESRTSRESLWQCPSSLVFHESNWEWSSPPTGRGFREMVIRLQSRPSSPPLPTGRKAGHSGDLPVNWRILMQHCVKITTKNSDPKRSWDLD